MQWWCVARTSAWTWEWAPYPGVWLFVALIAFLYLRLARRLAAEPPEDAPPSSREPGPWGLAAVPRRRLVSFSAGLILLWAALDWPVGPLAAGYLASVHMVQLLVISLVVPALLLWGVPSRAFGALASRPVAGRILRVVTHPVAALVVYNGVVVGSHVPSVLDALSATQLGMLAMDVSWLLAGAVFWWPVLAPAPRREWFGPFFKMGYLFLNTVPATLPYGFLVFADFPLYATYELAPPFPGVSTVRDQRIAGLVMKLGGGVILWTAMTVVFFRWWREEGDDPPARGPARARPGAGGS